MPTAKCTLTKHLWGKETTAILILWSHLTVQVGNVKIVFYKMWHIVQHVVSVGILFELHSQEMFGGNFLLHLKFFGSFYMERLAESLSDPSATGLWGTQATSGAYLTVHQPAHTAIALIVTCYHSGFLLGLFFDPEEWGDMFLQNLSWLSTECTSKDTLIHIHHCENLKSCRYDDVHTCSVIAENR
jgi:hypothetical protein